MRKLGVRSQKVVVRFEWAPRYQLLPPPDSTSASNALVPPHHAHDHALHLHLIRVDHDGLHGGIRRLQSDTPVFAIELLQRDVEAADQRNHHLAVVGALSISDDDVVAVADLLVDHRISLDTEDVAVALAS